jgi:Tfp pilus assembly protein PilN
MDLSEQIKQNPMSWKDWATVIGVVLTLSGVILQGGKILANQETQTKALNTLIGKVEAVNQDVTRLSIELSKVQGRDELHDAQLEILSKEVDYLKRRGR